MNEPETILGLLSSALVHHQNGRLAEAESFYRRVLALEPGHA